MSLRIAIRRGYRKGSHGSSRAWLALRLPEGVKPNIYDDPGNCSLARSRRARRKRFTSERVDRGFVPGDLVAPIRRTRGKRDEWRAGSMFENFSRDSGKFVQRHGQRTTSGKSDGRSSCTLATSMRPLTSRIEPCATKAATGTTSHRNSGTVLVVPSTTLIASSMVA